MKFFDEIHNQPQHIREIMFGLSVFITVLLIGLVWFNSFQKNLYVLMNPEGDVEKALAVENSPAPSLFSYVGKSFGEIQGLVSSFFGDESSTVNTGKTKVDSGKIYMLPLSERK